MKAKYPTAEGVETEICIPSFVRDWDAHTIPDDFEPGVSVKKLTPLEYPSIILFVEYSDPNQRDGSDPKYHLVYRSAIHDADYDYDHMTDIYKGNNVKECERAYRIFLKAPWESIDPGEYAGPASVRIVPGSVGSPGFWISAWE